jgi:GNAT superfamily N-acetyltransferase
VLTDGGLVRLRHLGPGDREALLAHHERCSFLVGVAGGEVAAGLLGEDGRHRVALVALVGTDIVGVGRYDVDPVGRDAEVVVAVEDRHQGRGVGTLLVGELAVLATNGDVRRLRAMTGHGRDEPLARTFRRAGLAFRSRRDGDAVVLESGLPQDMSATAST